VTALAHQLAGLIGPLHGLSPLVSTKERLCKTHRRTLAQAAIRPRCRGWPGLYGRGKSSSIVAHFVPARMWGQPDCSQDVLRGSTLGSIRSEEGSAGQTLRYN
jgi:hypothetical protein